MARDAVELVSQLHDTGSHLISLSHRRRIHQRGIATQPAELLSGRNDRMCRKCLLQFLTHSRYSVNYNFLSQKVYSEAYCY